MAKIGYARVSSRNQSLDRQMEKLSNCEKIFTEKISGADSNRPELNNLLNFIREGDVIVITELDRLGRSNKDLTEILGRINSKGATLEVLNLPTLSGIEDDNLRLLINNLMIEIYKYQAESERQSIRERQRQGIKIAKKAGIYKGRKPMFRKDDPKLVHAFNLFKQGLTDTEVEKLTGINKRTFQRYRKKYNIYRDSNTGR